VLRILELQIGVLGVVFLQHWRGTTLGSHDAGLSTALVFDKGARIASVHGLRGVGEPNKVLKFHRLYLQGSGI
jgi:hypothetical protein